LDISEATEPANEEETEEPEPEDDEDEAGE
jgi:hypothetical protein